MKKALLRTLYFLPLIFLSFSIIAQEDDSKARIEADAALIRDPATGKIPIEKLLQARLEIKKRLSKKRAIGGIVWHERGPNNAGGRTRALVFDPNDATAKKVWAGGVGGGLWYNTDITSYTNWQKVDDFWTNLAITSIVFDPSNTQNMYVGTGEGWFNSDAQRGAGIWKSSNGGVNWTQLASTASNADFNFIQKIIVNSTGAVFAATRGGVYKSTDGGTTWTSSLKPTTLAGAVAPVNDFAADLEIGTDNVIYASFGRFSNQGSRIFKSADAGTTWIQITPDGDATQYRTEIALAPSTSGASQVIYAITQEGVTYDTKWLKKSVDAGTTWTDATPAVSITRTQADYALILAVKPDDPNVVIGGGATIGRTTNGSTWVTRGYGTGNLWPDNHAVVFRPGFPNEVVHGNDGGVYYSPNHGNAAIDDADIIFHNRNRSFNVTQYYAVAIKNIAGDGYVLAGAQDNGTHKITSALNTIGGFGRVGYGDGTSCFIDQDQPDYQIYSSPSGIYSFYNGTTGISTSLGISGTRFEGPSDYNSNQNVLYAEKSSTTMNRVEGIGGATSNSVITHTSVGRTSLIRCGLTNNTVYVGGTDGSIIKIVNAGDVGGTQTITTIAPVTFVGTVSCIEIGATENELLITHSNYGVTSVRYTTDGGTNWISKDEAGYGLPDMPVRYALFNPTDRKQVLLATELGVFSTDDITAANPGWEPTNASLANVSCRMLRYRTADGTVAVATFGRGIFTTNFCTSPTLTVGSNSPVTVGGTINLTATTTATSFLWSGPNTFTSTAQNPIIASATMAMAGVYTINVTSTVGNCMAMETVNVVVNPAPTVCSPPTGAIAGSNSPVTVGSPINLTSSSTGGTSQTWTGPNVFTSAAQNPIIASATLAMAGFYTVTITSSGTCTATAMVNVVVNPAPTVCSPPTGAIAGSNSPVTVGSPINLTSSSTGGTSQTWTGPNVFTSAAQNPTIASATAAMAGFYTVTITSSGTCTATAMVNVVVNPAPTVCSPPTGAIAGSNSPVTVGSPINLTSSSTGGTSQTWRGPNVFTSAAQNPIIASATLAMAGFYTVTITSSGTCTATAMVNVVINPAPTVCSPPTGAIAGSNSPVTVGSPINLTSSSTGGTSQTWRGPNVFTSAAQNPIIASATLAMAGFYTVTITSSGTCTATAMVNVVINPAPTVCSPPTGAIAGSNSPVTVGSPINLTSSSTGGTSQTWRGPNVFTSAAQNPIIASATAAMAGFYTVTITSSGTCTATAMVNVVVNASPTASIAYIGSPFSKSASPPVNVILTGTTGGVFTASPTGLTISSSTGQITPSSSTIGTYTITYTIAATGGNPAVIATTSVTIANSFITTWKTDNPGTSNSNQITIPTNTNYAYNYTVAWGDGSSNAYTTNAAPTHTYSTAGTYTVSITGNFPALKFANGGDKLKLLSIAQWGTGTWSGMDAAFDGCANMQGTFTDAPVFAPSSTLYRMFRTCSSFNINLNNWNMTNVRETSSMFEGATIFNGNLDFFNTASVTNMFAMFRGCAAFNQALPSSFNTANVTNMGSMFYGCAAYNQALPISFNTAKVTDMNEMFDGCTAYNQALPSSFNTASVTNMRTMFKGCTAFNKALPISFNTASVTTMFDMFGGCAAFNQALPSSFNAANVTNMGRMFYGCTAYNQALPSSFNTAKVTDMAAMFESCTAYNQSLPSSFNTASVTNMGAMFKGCTAFNQALPISFNTALVNNMFGMFESCTAYNQTLPSSFNTANVTDMGKMFSFCTAYNQALSSSFNTSSVTTMRNMFFGCTAYNQALPSSFNTANVTDMRRMFDGCTAYNQSLPSSFNTVSVTNMGAMFKGCTAYNQSLPSSFNTAKVTEMFAMFQGAISFNQNIGDWAVANVIFMDSLFAGANAFNQNLGTWNITKALYMKGMFKNSGISTDNYDAILNAWNTAGYTNKNLGDVSPLKYCAGQAARTNMITNKGWSITGDAYSCPIIIVYVNANNTNPTQDGTTWAKAFSKLNDGLTAAGVLVGTPVEVWVAKGTYKPTNTITRTIYFNIPNNVKVYGGFAGSESALIARNFRTNVSILSGDIGTQKLASDNSYHVVVMNGSSASTVLDGFTISDGYANFDPNRTFLIQNTPSLTTSTIETGGGIVVQNGGLPTIANCMIINNAAVTGGGLYAGDASKPTITACKFMSNQAGFGSGIYLQDGSNGKVNNTLITGNKGIGGVYNNYSNPMFTNVTFSGNGGYNGGIFNSNSQPVVKNSIIWGNSTPFNDTQSIITYSNIQGGYAGIGNLNINPKFVNGYPEGLAPTISGDYHVLASSLTIDRAENGVISLTDIDLDGNLRRYAGGRVDMGAYEFQGTATATLVISIQAGNWESNSTWDVGRVPQLGDYVIIDNNHIVTLNGTGIAKNLQYRGTGQLKFNTNTSKIEIGF